MTNKEALKKVKGYLTDYLSLEDADEIDEIIEALKQQPSDTVIKKLSKKYYVEDTYGYTDEELVNKVNEIIDAVNDLPSVTPQQKLGHWEYVQYDNNPNIGNWHCSECRGICTEMHSIEDAYNYCHNCGAKMVESEK